MANRTETDYQAETYFAGGKPFPSPRRAEWEPGIPSRAAINGHPIHPILVTMPVAFLTTALATDFVSRWGSDPFWARSSRWLIGGGLVTGCVAAAVGLVDFLLIDRVRSVKAGWIHLIGNALALLLSLQNLRIRFTKAKSVPKQGLILSLLVSFLLALTGWYGGQLIYKHKIAVAGHQEE
jgi:uncharacterized membrane protein